MTNYKMKHYFHRYLLFGDISAKAAQMLSLPKVTCLKEKGNDSAFLLI